MKYARSGYPKAERVVFEKTSRVGRHRRTLTKSGNFYVSPDAYGLNYSICERIIYWRARCTQRTFICSNLHFALWGPPLIHHNHRIFPGPDKLMHFKYRQPLGYPGQIKYDQVTTGPLIPKKSDGTAARVVPNWPRWPEAIKASVALRVVQNVQHTKPNA